MDDGARHARLGRVAHLAVPVAAVVVGLLAVVSAAALTDHADPTDVAPYVQGPESQPVTDRDDVVGRWRVVEVEGGPVPPDAIRGMQIERLEGERINLITYDGLNTANAQVVLTGDGALEDGQTVTTLIGCGPDGTDESCTSPSGFGVEDARQLRLTPDGDLVLVGEAGTALAVYERTR